MTRPQELPDTLMERHSDADLSTEITPGVGELFGSAEDIESTVHVASLREGMSHVLSLLAENESPSTLSEMSILQEVCDHAVSGKEFGLEVFMKMPQIARMTRSEEVRKAVVELDHFTKDVD